MLHRRHEPKTAKMSEFYTIFPFVKNLFKITIKSSQCRVPTPQTLLLLPVFLFTGNYYNVGIFP